MGNNILDTHKWLLLFLFAVTGLFLVSLIHPISSWAVQKPFFIGVVQAHGSFATIPKNVVIRVVGQEVLSLSLRIRGRRDEDHRHNPEYFSICIWRDTDSRQVRIFWRHLFEVIKFLNWLKIFPLPEQDGGVSSKFESGSLASVLENHAYAENRYILNDFWIGMDLLRSNPGAFIHLESINLSAPLTEGYASINDSRRNSHYRKYFFPEWCAF